MLNSLTDINAKVVTGIIKPEKTVYIDSIDPSTVKSLQPKIDSGLETVSESVVGAINEVNAAVNETKDTVETISADIAENGEKIADLQETASSHAEQISKNINNIALLADVQYQAGLQYIQPIEDTYSERITANGENVLDWQGHGSTSRLLKVEGNTQATRNLINPALTTGVVTYAVDGNSLVFTNTKGSPSSFYLYSVKQTKGTYTLSVKDIAGESSRRFISIYKDGVAQQTLTTFPAVVTITLDEDAEISLRGEVGIGDYVTTTVTELQLVEGVYTEDTMPEYTPYFDGLKSASFQGIISSGVGESVLSFPAPIECGLGVTIDFENQKILNYGVDITLTGEEQLNRQDFRSMNGVYFVGLMNSEETLAKAVVTDGEVPPTQYVRANDWWIGVSSTVIYWTGILDILGFTDSWVDKTTPTEEERISSLEQFRDYLRQRYADGNPVKIRYVSSTLQSEIPFTDEQKAVGNEYTAWKGGEERVQGNDNATYDINPTMTQEYIVVTNVKEDAV